MGRLTFAFVLFLMPVSAALAKATDRGAPAAAAPAPAPAPLATKLAWHSTRAPQLLRTGFRLKPDAGEVLLQTSSEVELEARTSKEGTVFLLKRCRAVRRTDRLPLETRFFNSPVTRVAVKQRGGDLEIAISLRHPTTAVPRKEAGPGGSWFWVIEFPATGDTRTTAAATP